MKVNCIDCGKEDVACVHAGKVVKCPRCSKEFCISPIALNFYGDYCSWECLNKDWLYNSLRSYILGGEIEKDDSLDAFYRVMDMFFEKYRPEATAHILDRFMPKK